MKCSCTHKSLQSFSGGHQYGHMHSCTAPHAVAIGCPQNSQLGNFDVATLLSNPNQVLDQYVAIAKKEGTKIAIIFGVTLAVFNWLMIHQALNQKIKQTRR